MKPRKTARVAKVAMYATDARSLERIALAFDTFGRLVEHLDLLTTRLHVLVESLERREQAAHKKRARAAEKAHATRAVERSLAAAGDGELRNGVPDIAQVEHVNLATGEVRDFPAGVDPNQTIPAAATEGSSHAIDGRGD